MDCVKRVDKKITVIVGGRCITPVPVPAMRAFENVDVGILGEGELTARELVPALNLAVIGMESMGLFTKRTADWSLRPRGKYPGSPILSRFPMFTA